MAIGQKSFPISRVVAILRKEVKRFKEPIVGIYARQNAPFLVLISTLLSLRTKDKTTLEASGRLFAVADSPKKIAVLPLSKLEKLIFPVGFYRNKAVTLKHVSQVLIDEYRGKVPDDLDELLKIKGVGRKTANLVITLAFNKPGICVDIHVHRITNRWGYVNTKNPQETEFKLREILPKSHWIEINDILVAYGQNLCVPVSPHCSQCKIEKFCGKKDVKKSR